MIRVVEGFHADDVGDWVAELSCLHAQHVRHRPPLWPRPWVTTAEGRAAYVGAELDCPRCDRAELPDGLRVARTAGPFDATTLPDGLRDDHRVAAHTWGLLRILEGEIDFSMATAPPTERILASGDEQPIPPDVVHRLDVRGPVRLVVEFLTRVDDARVGTH